MYTKVPKIDTKNIITNKVKTISIVNEIIQNEILPILKTAMETFFFQFEQKYYKQMD
jgi:hypothetical protein